VSPTHAMEPLKELQEFFCRLEPGQIRGENSSKIERLLFENWHSFEDHEWGKLEGYKILHRMETPDWNPPNFSFVIERHGATVGGSIWAHLQKYILDIPNLKVIDVQEIGKRQVGKRNPSWKAKDVEATANEIAELISKGVDDPRLKWTKAGKGKVRPVMDQIIPDYASLPRWTADIRRKRFNDALTTKLDALGWSQSHVYYEKSKK